MYPYLVVVKYSVPTQDVNWIFTYRHRTCFIIFVQLHGDLADCLRKTYIPSNSAEILSVDKTISPFSPPKLGHCFPLQLIIKKYFNVYFAYLVSFTYSDLIMFTYYVDTTRQNDPNSYGLAFQPCYHIWNLCCTLKCNKMPCIKQKEGTTRLYSRSTF